MSSEQASIQLVERIHAGDKTAEAELFTQVWRGLYFILRQRSGDPELAADIAQEAIIVTIKKARNGEIENPSAIAAFVRNTANNLLIASYRKNTRQKTDALEEDEAIWAEFQHSPEQQINQQQVRKIIQQVLDELPTVRDKEVLQRYFSYGHSKSEVCEALDLTPAHFDRVIYRAKQRLRDMLNSQHGIGADDASLHLLLSAVLVVTLHSSVLIQQQIDPIKENSKVGETRR